MFNQLHSALRGYLDPSALPKALQGIFKAIQAKRARQGNRSVRRHLKAMQYRAAALAGGGSREVARRARQIAAGQLQVTA